VLTRCFLQIGDGTSGTDRLTPVAVVGLGSGVANVALGYVRLLVQRGCWCFFWGGSGCAVARVGLLCRMLCLQLGGAQRLVARFGWGARGGPHAWFTVSFLCCSKQRGGLMLGAE